MTDTAAENEHFFLRTTQRRGKAVVTLEGTVDVSVVHALTQTLARVARHAERELVVDLADAKLIDSAALGALVLVQKQVRRQGGELVLAGAKGEIRRLLGVTGLDRVFRLAAGPAGA
jgi:anti-sigma B factor antagonist